MARSNRIALFTAAVLVVLVTGSVFATRAPQAEQRTAPAAEEAEADAPPAAEDLEHATDRLSDAGISVDEAEFADLASRYGVGGAVRIYAWATPEMGTEAIAAKRDAGMGWGQIAKELGVNPGIGSIMGNGGGHGGGHGRDTAPGQLKQDDAPDE